MTELTHSKIQKTKKGRSYSHFTLFCKFHQSAKYENPKFTYRGDKVLRQMHIAKNRKFANQIEALTYQAELVKSNIKEAVLFDNSFEHPFNIVTRWINGDIIEDYSSQYFMHPKDGLCRSIPDVEETEKTKLIIEKNDTNEKISKKTTEKIHSPGNKNAARNDRPIEDQYKNTASVQANVNKLVDAFKVRP